MATFKEISAADITTARSALNQLVDIIQEDISGSNTRKKYQVFVTGGVGPGVTSSMFQTIYDQDFSLQTANPIFDITVGICSGSATVASCSVDQDDTGKLLFPSTSLMMREKVDIYRQFAQTLLGDANQAFFAPVCVKSSHKHKSKSCCLDFVGFDMTLLKHALFRAFFASLVIEIP